MISGVKAAKMSSLPTSSALFVQGSVRPWVHVICDIRPTGGMEKANRVLLDYLLSRGIPVHLVCHSVDKEISNHPLLSVYLVRKPLSSDLLGEILLSSKGRQVARSIRSVCSDAPVVVNGGNCLVDGVNWCHFVHHAWNPNLNTAAWLYRVRHFFEKRWACWRERRAFAIARLIITNSEMTSRDVIAAMKPGLPPKVECVYLGADGDWGAVTEKERAHQRRGLGIRPERLVALFVGALGQDDRKGLESAVRAWSTLCKDHRWDVDLLIAGAGAGRDRWESFVKRNGLSERVRFLGYRTDIRAVLACADLLISPVKYEPYGLNVQEALTRGIPVITSRRTGVAERLPQEFDPLLCDAEPSAADLTAALEVWRACPGHWRSLAERIGQDLCGTSWTAMAERIVSLVEHEYLLSPKTIEGVPCS
jgi:glycosyltransferase involved in cell wall biosynthesis